MTTTLPAALDGRRLAVVDVEGNGGQPPEIVEIAVLALDGGITAENLTTRLVRPSTPITSLVTRKVHGISNTDVAGCPAWAEVADDIADLLADRVLIAHSAAVEHRVLSAHLPSWQPPMVLDTLRLAKRVWPELTGYSLDRLITHAGLDDTPTPGRRHRADYDAWMTAHLLVTLIDHAGLDWDGLVKVGALAGWDEPDPPQGGLW